MRISILVTVLLLAVTAASPVFGQGAKVGPGNTMAKQDTASGPSAEVKAGLGIKKNALTGSADSFKVVPGTRIYGWARVTGVTASKAAPATVTMVFAKDGKPVFKKKLELKSSPCRTNACLRVGDAGSWTVQVLSPDSKEIGSVRFEVQLVDKK